MCYFVVNVKPVCAAERIWSRDSDDNEQVIWNQGCAEVDSCAATWEDWPYFERSFFTGSGRSPFLTTHRICEVPSCEQPTGNLTYRSYMHDDRIETKRRWENPAKHCEQRVFNTLLANTTLIIPVASALFVDERVLLAFSIVLLLFPMKH